jgi:hypothetical protein
MSVSYAQSEVRRLQAEVDRYDAAFKQQVAIAFNEIHRVEAIHYSNLSKLRRDITHVGNCRHLSTDLTDSALLEAFQHGLTNNTPCVILQLPPVDIHIIHQAGECNVMKNLPIEQLRRIPEESKEVRRPLVNYCTCTRTNRQVDLPCSHSVCALCFQDYVVSQSKGHDFSIASIKCPYCGSLMPQAKVFQVFTGEREFYSRIGGGLLGEPEVPTFNCLICAESKPVEGSLTLNCEHRFCIDCIRDFLTDLIDRGKVSETELVCPSHRCGTAIDEPMLKYCLREETMERLDKLRIRNIKAGKEVMVYCPNSACKNGMFIHADIPWFVCSECQGSYCLKCNETYHQGHRCPADSAKADEIKAQFGGLDVKQCPCCNEGVVKESGCNFMRCYSSQCMGKRYFCWLCLSVLRFEEHYDHYPQAGPFGSKCSKAY